MNCDEVSVMDIKTYPEMNDRIKDILTLSEAQANRAREIEMR